MGIYTGDGNQFGFFYESGTYAVVSGALQWPGLVTNHEPDEALNRLSLRYAGTDTRNVDKHVNLQEDYTGVFTYQPQDWKFLMFALGSNVDAGAPTPFTHTISESNGGDGNAFTSGTKCPFISFGFEDFKKGPTGGKNFKRNFVGCSVDSFDMTIESPNPINIDVGYVAQNVIPTSGAASALSETTTRPFIYSDTVLTLDGTNVDFNTTNFSINNNLNSRHYGNGSKVIGALVPENRVYELNVDSDMESQLSNTFYNKHFKGGSEFNAKLVITDVGAGAGSRDMTMTLSGCKMMDMEAPGPIEGVNPQSLVIEPKSVSVVVNDLIEEYNAF